MSTVGPCRLHTEKGSCLCGTPVASVTKAVLFSSTVERSSGLWRGMQQLDIERNGQRVTMGGSEAPVSTGGIGFAPTGSINFICRCLRVVFSSRRSLALECQAFLERNHKVSDEFGAQPAHAFHASQHCATMSAEKANHEQLSVAETAMSVFGPTS